MKKRHAQASVARGKAEQNNVAKPFCINSPNYASLEQYRRWVRSAAARSRTGKRPITMPRLRFIEGGDDE